MLTPSATLPVVVIGAGPVGLAAAAHLRERAVPTVVLEAGPDGAAGVATWGHVQLFSPWSYLIDDAARRLLAPTGWVAPAADTYPTGSQWREAYLLPLAAALGDALRTGVRVQAVSRQGHDLLMDEGREDAPFVVTATGPAGEERVLAAAVIDASGTLGTPSPLGAGGTPALGEPQARAAGVVTSRIPDLTTDDSFTGRHTVVAGAGHSAMTAVLGLAEVVRTAPGTQVTWVLRRPLTPERLGGGVNDALARRGALGLAVGQAVEEGLIQVAAPFRVDAIRPLDPTAGQHAALRDGGGAAGGADARTPVPQPRSYELLATDGSRLTGVDRVLALTGYRPDLTLAGEIRLDLDPSLQAPRKLAPLIDPNIHSCGTVPPHGVAELRHHDDGFFLAGMKSYGRAPTFLALTGYEQVRSIVAAIVGDHDGAARVDLTLPETGVCGGSGLGSLPLADDVALAGSGCCG